MQKRSRVRTRAHEATARGGAGRKRSWAHASPRSSSQPRGIPPDSRLTFDVISDGNPPLGTRDCAPPPGGAAGVARAGSRVIAARALGQWAASSDLLGTEGMSVQ